ncbi:hypothetical protein ACQKWADRAFT_14299 [Trichoderma austrokoningii]
MGGSRIPSAPEFAVPRSLQAMVATVGAGGKLERSGFKTKTTQAVCVSDPIPIAKGKKIEIMTIHLGLLNNLENWGGRLLKVPVLELEQSNSPLSFPCPNAFFVASSHPAAPSFGTPLRPLAAPGTKYPPDRLRKVLPPEICMLSSITPQTPPASWPAWSCRLVAQISERLKVILFLPSTSLVFRLTYPSLSLLRQISSCFSLFDFAIAHRSRLNPLLCGKCCWFCPPSIVRHWCCVASLSSSGLNCVSGCSVPRLAFNCG